MVKIICLFLFVYVFSYANTPPAWFLNINPQENQIIGYGDSTELDKAKEYALKEIANSISTRIESYFIMHQKSDSKNGFTKEQERFFKQSTDVKIEDIVILKSSFVNNTWYIALSYDYTPFAVKYKDLLINEKLTNENQNSYLSKTTLIKNLNSIIGYNLNYDLYSKEGMWYLAYKDKSMKISQKDFENLFTFVDSKIIELDSNKNVFTNNDSISFNITTQKEGYISLLYLGLDGQVGIIDKNILIKKKLKYPNKDKIILKKRSKENTKFMIFALFSDDKMNLKNFEFVSKKDVKNYDFNLLLKELTQYSYTTYIGKITN